MPRRYAIRHRRKGNAPAYRMKRNLALGETPFDDLDRESLIRLLCAHQSALGAVRSALSMARLQQRDILGALGPFWVGPAGYARRAMAKADHLAELVSGPGERHLGNQVDGYLRHVDELAFPPDPGDVTNHPTMTCGRCATWCRSLSGDASRPFQANLRLCGPGGRDCPPHEPLTWEILRAGEREPAAG